MCPSAGIMRLAVLIDFKLLYCFNHLPKTPDYFMFVPLLIRDCTPSSL